MMTTITITLPDDLAEEARAKGLLSSAAIESYLRARLHRLDDEEEESRPNELLEDKVFESAEFDPQREGAVNPAMEGKGKALGDIVGPFQDTPGEKGQSV